MRRRLLIGAALLLLSGALGGIVRADDPTPPTLTDVQKLQLQNRVLTVQLAHAQLDALIRDLSVPGYDVSVATLDYVKKPAPTAP